MSTTAVLSTRPRAILFDWDNTLVDTWMTIHEALNHVMVAMDKPPWSLAETRARVRLSLRESFPLHFGDRWEEARGIYLDRFSAIHLERLDPLAGLRRDAGGARRSRDLPWRGQQQDRSAAAARGRPAWLVAIFWPRCRGWGRRCRQTRSGAGRLALAPCGVDAGAEVWFVGDTGVDIECASNAGCVSVLLG